MNFNKLNNRAWAIRKMAAKKFNCPVNEIEWGLCLAMANEITNDSLNVKSTLSESGQFILGFLSGLLFLVYFCM